jgi:transcription initiation factor TFIID/TFIIF subunit
MSIVLQPFSQPKGEQTVFHDLNFQQERYESLQQFVRLTALLHPIPP